MPRYTDRWGLSILGPGDSIQGEGFKFSDADRRLIDRLLEYAAEGHRHTGAAGTNRTPAAGLNLTLQPTGGSIPAGARYYYRFTVVDDVGNESAGSPIQSIEMPLAVTAPQAPAPTPVTGTGDLQPGTYSYTFSAYRDVSTLETKAINSAAVKIPGNNAHNSVQMTLPDLPIGATGLNCYRKSPSGLHYLFLVSIAASSNGQSWIDDGTAGPNPDRTLPPINRTSNDNMVFVAYPGATPTIPEGWSWRIYRTQDPADWGRSFLTELRPLGTPPTTPTVYPDVGSATSLGGPPASAQVIKAPDKIDLTDAAEVQGELPPGCVTVPHVISFTHPGPVTVGQGTFTWVCEFEEADIVDCRAYLGVGSKPATQDVIVDVHASRPSQGQSTWASIYNNGPTRPTVPVGTTVGTPTTPSVTHLEAGDLLRVDRDQAGGGATPTDLNLVVNVLMYTKYGPTDASYDWNP